ARRCGRNRRTTDWRLSARLARRLESDRPYAARRVRHRAPAGDASRDRRSRTLSRDHGRRLSRLAGVSVRVVGAGLRVANLLVGNDDSLAAIEATLIGPTLTFEQSALIALGGADLEASIDGTALPPWKPAAVAPGATLRFGKPRLGCRAYLTVAGGIDVPPVFGSRGTYVRASFGGLEGRALRAGDCLCIGEPSGLSARIASSLHSDDD